MITDEASVTNNCIVSKEYSHYSTISFPLMIPIPQVTVNSPGFWGVNSMGVVSLVRAGVGFFPPKAGNPGDPHERVREFQFPNQLGEDDNMRMHSYESSQSKKCDPLKAEKNRI
jgi:hypothetical protein